MKINKSENTTGKRKYGKMKSVNISKIYLNDWRSNEVEINKGFVKKTQYGFETKKQDLFYL